jgi:hypothetical protein
MMNAGSRNSILGIASALVLVGLASGCTCGDLVDENFQIINDWRTGRASITFKALDSNLMPNGTNYSFNLNGQPYISFDAYAPDGATNPNYPNLVNSKQFIPEGNYQVEYFQPSVGFARSPRFAHSYTYPNNCTDTFTGKANADADCQFYYFQLNYHCPLPTGGIQTLQTHNGFSVIPMCVAF